MKQISASHEKVHAVVVSYYPDPDLIKKCVESLSLQCEKVYVVDNTPGGFPQLEELKAYNNVEVIYLKDNYGVAYAQNVGIKRALESGSHYVLLSDQDSVYPENFVKSMLECFREEKVIACGPLFLDTNRGDSRFFVIKSRCGFKRIYPEHGKYEVFQLISSGMLIKTELLKDVGLMMEELFIDWVDMEWCWRAVKKGYRLIGNADVVIEHGHGESSRTFLWRRITLKSSLRYYYTVRNAVYLALYTDILPPVHRTVLFIKILRNIFIYTLLSERKLNTLKHCAVGLYHGIIGRLGKYEKN